MPGGSYKTAKPLPVRSTAVIGGGTMGSGIAVCLLSAGLPVYLLEQNEKVSPISRILSSCQGFNILYMYAKVFFLPFQYFCPNTIGYAILCTLCYINE